MGSSSQKSSKNYAFRLFDFVQVPTTGNTLRDIHCISPRSGHRMIATNGNVYSFGGYNPTTVGGETEHILFKELWIYNCASKTWKLLETTGKVPEELASHSAALVDNNLLTFAGTAFPFGNSSGNDTHFCNLNTLHWTKLETIGDHPQQEYGQAMAVLDNNVYVIGGTTGFLYSNKVHRLNLVTKKWEQLTKKSKPFQQNIYEPEPRYRHEIVIYDNKIFMFGGGTSDAVYGFEELPVFDLETNTWSLVATKGSFPEPRRCHICAQCDCDVYICGGFNNSISFKCIYKIDLKTLVWEKLDICLPHPLYFHAAAISESHQLFIFGGLDEIENQRINDMYSFFVKIPSLATIAWQAMLHYIPNIAFLEKKLLFELGVPIRFLNEMEFCSDSDVTNQQDFPEDDGDSDWEDLS